MPEITIGKNSISLQEYNGTYSLVDGWINQDGVFKENWCKRRFGGKDAPEKNTPVKINCGNQDDVIGLAYWILDQFKHTNTTKDYDIPF